MSDAVLVHEQDLDGPIIPRETRYAVEQAIARGEFDAALRARAAELAVAFPDVPALLRVLGEFKNLEAAVTVAGERVRLHLATATLTEARS